MLVCPITLTIVNLAVSDTKCNDLLLDASQCAVGIITHTDILFHCVVHFRRNIYRAVSMESKALADQAGISAICLDALARLCHHRGRRKNHAVNTVSVQLMIQ